MTNLYVIGAIVFAAAILGWLSAKYLGPDNPIEEACEEIIEQETGKKVDLTPTASISTPTQPKG